jgi:hypothetical protein
MHLNTELALDLLDGRLAQDQEVFWRQHLDACDHCAQEVHLWERLRLHLKRSHLQSASDSELETALNIFPRPAEGGGSLRRILAAIVFDSLLQPDVSLAGARGESSPQSRQMVMRAEEFDIHIKIWGEREHRQMLGQLLPRKGQESIPSARFHLLRNGERIDSTTTDEMGEFSFMDVPEGDLSLQIDLPNLTVIGALNVQEPS